MGGPGRCGGERRQLLLNDLKRGDPMPRSWANNLGEYVPEVVDWQAEGFDRRADPFVLLG